MKYLTSKTLWLAILAGITGILTVVGQLTPTHAGEIQTALAVLAFLNRFITNTPIGNDRPANTTGE